MNPFHVVLAGVAMSGSLSLMLLAEFIRLRKELDFVRSEANGQDRMLKNVLGSLSDLQAVTTVHGHAVSTLARRALEQSRRLNTLEGGTPVASEPVTSEPGDVHPFAADAFITLPPEPAAA